MTQLCRLASVFIVLGFWFFWLSLFLSGGFIHAIKLLRSLWEYCNYLYIDIWTIFSFIIFFVMVLTSIFYFFRWTQNYWNKRLKCWKSISAFTLTIMEIYLDFRLYLTSILLTWIASLSLHYVWQMMLVLFHSSLAPFTCLLNILRFLYPNVFVWFISRMHVHLTYKSKMTMLLHRVWYKCLYMLDTDTAVFF